MYIESVTDDSKQRGPNAHDVGQKRWDPGWVATVRAERMKHHWAITDRFKDAHQ
jgi:hypothetical protein